MLLVQDLSLIDQTKIFEKINLSLSPGKLILLKGKNGSVKLHY